MTGNMLHSTAFLVSAGITMVAAWYAYIYLPKQMQKAYRQSLLTLSRAVETKDPSAVGHGERVSTYMVAVAKEMRVQKSEILKMEYAALLQDIGNVRVPHQILNKAGRLTDEEFGILRGHTTIGFEILEQVKSLRDIAPIVKYHHEAWDGSGYPDGLRGEDVPLGARILAVCTAYDSMIHARAYRQQLDEETAVREIRAGAGTRYDPSVVDAFLQVLKRDCLRERFSN
jgi:HD-GYP domain-containing protein (c-di-GMP phosphodiesterase class II)